MCFFYEILCSQKFYFLILTFMGFFPLSFKRLNWSFVILGSEQLQLSVFQFFVKFYENSIKPELNWSSVRLNTRWSPHLFSCLTQDSSVGKIRGKIVGCQWMSASPVHRWLALPKIALVFSRSVFILQLSEEWLINTEPSSVLPAFQCQKADSFFS